MYKIIKNVIERGDCVLEDILRKINSLWIDGTLDDEQRDELSGLARGTAKTENSVDVVTKIAELESRVVKLEQGASSPSEAPIEEYPEYVTDKWYYKGDKVTFSGKRYDCIAPDGQVCVWSPETYPAYWEEATN